MAKLNEKDKQRLHEDLLAGTETIRSLAKKYEVSPAAIMKYKALIDDESEQIVNAGVAYRTGLSKIEDQKKVNAIVNAVDERTKHITFLNNATLKNISTMIKKIDEKSTMYDHKLAQDTIAKGKEVLLGKEADTVINNQNNQSDIKSIQIVRDN